MTGMKLRYIVTMAAAVLAVAAAAAQDVYYKPRTYTEWGLKAGLAYPLMECDLAPEEATMKAGMGYSAGLQMGIVFRERFAIQPEIVYTYSTIKASTPDGFSTRIKSNSLRMPVLFSLRISAVRFNVGPVFSLTDNPFYADANGERVMFGRLTPTVSYSAGMAVSIWRKMLVDLRFDGRFNRTTNIWSTDADHTTEFKTRLYEIRLNVGYVF